MDENKIEILKKFGYPESLIKEYDNWYLLLRTKQITLGSLVLMCKDPVGEYSRISNDSWREFPGIVKEIESQLSKLFSYDKINYIMLMMVDKIVHYHILPRYKEYQTFERVDFYDYSWPGPPDFSRRNELSDDIFNNLRKQLVKAFNNQENIRKKYGIIYTTGVFDLFHHGHLNILKRSKDLCDYLMVGVSTDELVEKVKNKKPIIPFRERVKIVQSIKYVDEVIEQYDKNKQKIVDTYGVDAITVGDDWKGKYPPISCELIYLSYTKEISTTLLREQK